MNKKPKGIFDHMKLLQGLRIGHDGRVLFQNGFCWVLNQQEETSLRAIIFVA